MDRGFLFARGRVLIGLQGVFVTKGSAPPSVYSRKQKQQNRSSAVILKVLYS